MAKPTTRQGLIDYCLRRLGAPVLEINVDDDQIDDLVDDAIQLFNERHFDGVERMYLKYEVSQNDINRARGLKNGSVDSKTGVGIVTTTGTSTDSGAGKKKTNRISSRWWYVKTLLKFVLLGSRLGSKE